MRPAGAQPLHERGEMGIAAELAEAPRQRLEIHVRKRVRRGAAALEAVALEQVLADEVRRPSVPEIDARLTEIHRQQLRMHVGDVQQRHIAEGRQIVERLARPRLGGVGPQARARRCGQE